ncbi:MAG: protein kinase, partial [Chloroflexota bacterium]
MIGRTLGNYRLVEQIGLGGMATVYKAYDPDTDRYVAIKVLPQHFSQDPTFRERFHREAKAIAKLEHLHILPIFAYGEDDGTAYMVMRYLQTGTLTERIRQGPLPLSEASRLLSQIAGALDYAHTHGILHRDVKPSNVLLDAGGNAFLTDFGIAKMVEATLDLTGGGLLGTPAYMSPEQCRGSKELTPASDIYSLGIVLYEMVTGRTPFVAETPIALIHMQLNEALPLPRQLRPDLPEEAERIILKALAKEPESRYPSCGAMAAAFAQAVVQILAGQPPAKMSGALAGLPVEDVTLPHVPAGPTAVGPAPRRLPLWVFGLIIVLVGGGLIAAAVAAGLISFEQVTLEPTPTAAATAGPMDAPKEIRQVEPCEWDNHGPGLCIYPLAGGPPAKILTDTKLKIGSSAWSPDGQTIVFDGLEPGEDMDRSNNLYLVRVDGSGLVELPSVGNDIMPAWSPDGAWLAFHSNCSLALMRPDGSDPTVIWEGRGEKCFFEPEWSPDSRQLAASVQFGDGGWKFPMRREIWVISVDGQEVTRIAAVIQQRDPVHTEVAFSPDGARVAYVDDKDQFWLVNADGSGQPEALAEFPLSWTGTVQPQWERQPLPADEAAALEAGERCGPGGKVLFVDDFEDGQAGGWNFLSATGVRQSPWPVGVEEGNHFLVGKGHNWAQTGPDSWTNYSLHVRFRHVTADSDAHLNVRVMDGRYHVHLRGGLLKRDFTPKRERDVMLAQWDYQPDRAWHEFTLSAVGERLEAYLDGELVGAYDDPDPLPPGRIGLENLAGTT